MDLTGYPREDRGQALTSDSWDVSGTDATVRDPASVCGEGIPSSVSEFLTSQISVRRTIFLERLFGRPPVPRSAQALYRAARGEVAVIEALSQLGSEWFVRSCEPTGRSGVEYILIGPPGIFCMIVRHQPRGAIWIDGGVLLGDGERLPHLRDAEFCAVKLTQMMSDIVESRVEATPCLVLIGARSLTVAKPPRRVAVLMPRDIRTWIKGMPHALSHQELASLRTSASAHSEWHSVGTRESPSAAALDTFGKVQAELVQARHVRLTWVTGVLVLFWLAAVVGIGGVTTSMLLN